MVIVIRPEAYAEIDAETVLLTEGSRIRLGAQALPYGTGTLVVPRAFAYDLFPDLDPRDDIRVLVVGSNQENGTSRTFDMSVRNRSYTDDDQAVTLELATDEAILQLWAALAETIPVAWTDGAAVSLRAVITSVLATCFTPDPVLQPGSDADVRPVWQETNYATNPNAQTTASDWTVAGGGSALTPTTMTSPLPPQGTRAMRFTAAAGTAAVYVAGYSTALAGYKGIKCEAGEVWTLSFQVAGSTPRSVQAQISWRDANGNGLVGVAGAAVMESASAFVRVTVTATAPIGAEYITGLVLTAANTAGQFHYVANVQLTKTGKAIAYFDGGTPDTSTYNYGWEGTADLSASTRVPVSVSRDPAALTWPIGTSAWDFLETLCTAAGMRLYCDEARRWYLVDPDVFVAPGNVHLDPDNIVSISSTVDITDPSQSPTGVTVRYSWTDAAGAHERWDTAGTPARVYTVDIEGVYPGPGAAQAILNRRTGRGEVITAEAGLGQWEATPSQTCDIDVDDNLTLAGQVDDVEWDLATGLTTIYAQTLVAVNPDSWLAQPTGSWLAAPTGPWVI